MQIYLVGGAVRDQLLGLPVKERDWVVVGATPEQMLASGYKPVGKDFPVFLHPETHEEYALARTERKTGKGYTGFTFHTSPDVTLEEDLRRRDLTINAIAQTVDGKLIDPYNGQQDLKNKILRHVSTAFAEDPVRILRLARFAARFSDFMVDAHTNELMQQMVKNGEVDALVPERVWQELFKALHETHPYRFFEVQQNCGAFTILFPELVGYISLLATRCQCAVLSNNIVIRFAVIFSCLQQEQLTTLCERLRVPREFRELANLVILNKPFYNELNTLSAEQLLQFFENTDALRRKERFELLLIVYELLLNSSNPAKTKWLMAALTAIKAITVHDIKTQLNLDYQTLSGEKINDALYTLRLNAIKNLPKISS